MTPGVDRYRPVSEPLIGNDGSSHKRCIQIALSANWWNPQPQETDMRPGSSSPPAGQMSSKRPNMIVRKLVIFDVFPPIPPGQEVFVKNEWVVYDLDRKVYVSRAFDTPGEAAEALAAIEAELGLSPS